MALTPAATRDWSAAAAPVPPGAFPAALLIARRSAVESLRDRSTVLGSGFFVLILPPIVALSATRPWEAAGDGGARAALAVNLLLVGLLPTSSAVGSAAGQFAGELEQGNLTPLLASPAPNSAIFGGKVLGAVLPALLFALVAEVAYVGTLVAADGVGVLRRLPPGLALAMLALVPAVATLAAVVASLVSSRVRTYTAAQGLAGFALVPIWTLVGGLAFVARGWGPWALAAVVVGVAVVDAALVLVAAATWRREEVLARR